MRLRNKVLSNRGSLKQSAAERVLVLVNINFHILLPNLRKCAEVIKKTYIYDNVRKKIKLKIEKKEKT